MYEMTLFFQNLWKNNYLINIHQKISNCTINLEFSWGACSQTPLAKGMASLLCDFVHGIALTHANLHFRKKSIQIMYTLLAYMYKLIKDTKHKF